MKDVLSAQILTKSKVLQYGTEWENEDIHRRIATSVSP